MKFSIRRSIVFIALFAVALASAAPQARGQATAKQAASDSRFQVPESDDGLPGAGPIRRADWFKKLWAERRSAFATRKAQDQGAVVFLGDSITQGWGDNMGGAYPGMKVANRGISGDTSRGVLIRLQDDVRAL